MPIDKEKETYTYISDKIWKLKDIYQLDAMDIVLICRISSMDVCKISNQTFAEMYHVSSKTIQNHINKLCKLGLIKKRKKLVFDSVVGREMKINEEVINAAIELSDDLSEPNENEWE